jgi:hypothetical protein
VSYLHAEHNLSINNAQVRAEITLAITFDDGQTQNQAIRYLLQKIQTKY